MIARMSTATASIVLAATAISGAEGGLASKQDLAPCPQAEVLWIPSIFSEGMILQRDQPVPVWGRARAGAAVTVALYDGGRKLVAGNALAAPETGRWRLTLEPFLRIPCGDRGLPSLDPAEDRRAIGQTRLAAGQASPATPGRIASGGTSPGRERPQDGCD